MILKRFGIFLLFLVGYLSHYQSIGQCGGILEPGFAFLTSSRGCAPFTVNIQTLYLSSVPGTQYFINWGDGSPEEIYTQANPTGVSIVHTYPNNPVDCGYDLIIDASNACNPRGSVVPINTQVIVWTNDVVAIDPGVFRVCQGFAANMQFTDNSTWNCFPRATRENNEPRWIQWIYGTGVPAVQIPGIQVNGITPGAFPYFNPAPAQNPIFPVTAPGQQSLAINIPTTLPADIGKEFQVTLKNWNQCNPYDNNLLDGNPFNPVSGNLVTGDNTPQVTTARVVIVPSPVPDFISRLGNAAGPIQSVFCLGDNIFFDNETPTIPGAAFGYTWEFFDNNTGTGVPLSTSSSANPIFAYPTVGPKLIRLSVKDNNAVGNCVAMVEKMITISPALLAKINVTDINDIAITPDFCQAAASPFTTFQVKFTDASLGTPDPDTQWRWEFYNESNVMTRSEPAAGFSSVALGPFVESYLNRGIYKVKLIIRDNLTGCQTVDEIQVRVFEKPVPQFTASRGCEGTLISFVANATLQPIQGETVAAMEWDFNYNGTVFNSDPLFTGQTNFTRTFTAPGTYQVAFRATASISGCADIKVVPVIIDPLPLSQFTPDIISGCSELLVTFTNNTVTGQPDQMDKYVWEIDERGGLGFQPVLTQLVSDPLFTNQFINTFENVTGSNRLYDVRMRAITVQSCETISSPVTITVFPGTRSGFISTNYSPFNNNCSPQSVNFNVDSETTALNPTEYRWQVADNGGLIEEISTGTTPGFNYLFSNTSQAIKDFSVTLITTLPSGCFGDSTRTIRISPVPSSLFLIDTIQFDCNIMSLQVEAVQKGLQQYHWEVQENGVTTASINQIGDKFQYLINRPPSSTASINLTFLLDTKNFANCSSVVTNQSIIVPQRDDINASFTVNPVSQTLPGSTVSIVNQTNPGPWNYQWDFGDGTQSNSAAITSHTYSTYGKFTIHLTVTHGVCMEEQITQVEILAIPPIVDFEAAPPSGCVPLTVNFNNLSQFADPSTYQWDFGDSGKSGSISPTHTYYEPGKYSVSLSASNITGQVVTETKQAIIEVFPRPSSAFEIKPTVIYIPGGILYTNNRSFDASQYEWDFGDGNTSTAFEPQHKYKEEGIYTITLTAFNQFNCPDSTRLTNAVKVIKGGQVLIPNAFTPAPTSAGGDGKNDVFLPLMRGVIEFELLVFNRWGTLLFFSDDQNIGWDGTYQGKLCQQDVYVYKLTAAYDTGERIVRMGDINLLR